MANEFVHATVGNSLTQAEFEAVGLHVLNSQATGDLIYASSASQLSRVGIGSTNAILTVIGGVPTWQTSLSGLTFVAPALGAATATSINGLVVTTTAGTLTIANSASAALVTSGAYSITLTATAATNVTLPTTGTLSTLAGSEELDNKTLDSSVGKGTWTASGTWTLPTVTFGGTITGGSQTVNSLGNVGIWQTSTTTDLLKVEKAQTITDNSNYLAGWFRNTMVKTSAAYTGIGYGLMGSFEIGATNTQNWTNTEDSVGVYGSAYIYAGSTGTISELAGIKIVFHNAGGMVVTNGYGLHVLKPENLGAGSFGTFYGIRIRDVECATTNYAIFTGTGAIRFGGITYIGDTANTKMTLGLTINQAAATNEILAFKNSGVAHTRTTLAEADTFCQMTPGSANGGVTINSFTETGLAIGFQCQTWVADAVNTTKTTAGRGAIELNAYLLNGDAVQNMTADGNLVQIGTYGGSAYVARFLFDAEGSGHADVEWVAYDKYNDISLVKDMEAELVSMEYPAKTERRHQLEAIGVIGKDSWHMENGKLRAMINFTKLSMLHHGALIQLYDRINTLETENTQLKEKVQLLLE